MGDVGEAVEAMTTDTERVATAIYADSYTQYGNEPTEGQISHNGKVIAPAGISKEQRWRETSEPQRVFCRGQAAAAIAAYKAARAEAGFVEVPKELTRKIGDPMIEAMWPSGEVIHDDAFHGPEQQLSAGWQAMIATALGERE